MLSSRVYLIWNLVPLAKSDENFEMRTCAPTYMSGKNVRVAQTLYTVFFKICDESEIIVYVMPGIKSEFVCSTENIYLKYILYISHIYI